MLDLEVYHHLVYHYSASIIPEAKLRSDAFQRLLEHSLSCEFLMHSFMALSALHLYSKDISRSEVFDRACYLQGIAIQHVQPVIANLRQEDSMAALLFSSNTSAFGLAEYMLNPHHDDTDPIDKIIECFQLSRGIKIVVSPYWPYLTKTWLKTFFRTDPEDAAHENQIRATLSSEYPTYSMVRSLAFGQEDAERRKCCLETIEGVFTSIGALSKHPEDYPTSGYLVNQWIVTLPPVFKDMLVERRPIALIILAYWAVLSSINPRPWHLRGLPEVLIARVETILGDEWAEFLRWPKDRVIENASATQDTPALTPRFDDRNVDGQFNGMHLSHRSSSNRASDDARSLQLSPNNFTSNQASPYLSSHPSPYPPATDQPSPSNVGSNVHSPFNQGPSAT
jgi:hypothetical protein